jgi:hypothetical protein
MHPVNLQAIAAERIRDLRVQAAAGRRAGGSRRRRPRLRAVRTALFTRSAGSLN